MSYEAETVDLMLMLPGERVLHAQAASGRRCGLLDRKVPLTHASW
jgi:hypothetical protein